MQSAVENDKPNNEPRPEFPEEQLDDPVSPFNISLADWRNVTANWADYAKQTAQPFLRPLELFASADAPPAVSDSLKQEFDRVAVDAGTALEGAMKKSRVLAVGDYHIEPNPAAQVLADSMQKLKAAGATHLAVELDKRFQPYLDEFNKTGKLPDDVVATLRRVSKTPESLLALFNAAHAAGVKVVAVDDWGAGKNLPKDRDATMTGGIDAILKADKDAKVIYYAGNQHVRKGEDPSGELAKSAASMLVEKGYAVTSVLNAPGAYQSDALDKLNENLTSPKACDESKLCLTSKLELKGFSGSIAKPGSFDMVLVHPRTAGLEGAQKELKDKGQSPEEHLLKALKNNQVIEVMAYDKLNGRSGADREFWQDIVKHARRDMGREPVYPEGTAPDTAALIKLLPKLKDGGLTHIAIAAPLSPDVLDKFNRTGKLELDQRDMDTLSKDTIELMKAANKLGIKIVPLGSAGQAQTAHRILEDNPNAKMLIWNDTRQQPLSPQLREKGVRATSALMMTADYGSNGDGYPTAHVLPKLVKEPVAAATSSAALKKFKLDHDKSLGVYDSVIVFPR